MDIVSIYKSNIPIIII